MWIGAVLVFNDLEPIWRCGGAGGRGVFMFGFNVCQKYNILFDFEDNLILRHIFFIINGR